MKHKIVLTALVAWMGLVACSPRPVPGPATPVPAALAGSTWTLVEVDDRPAEPGAGARPATITFAADRATGFLGCNQFGAPYEASGGALRFQAVVSTRMACSAGMELERDFTAALEATRSYRRGVAVLELVGENGVLARFAASPQAR
ncbi:MAG TPA: META domain-containing protein [Longimicrobium sp.]|jgi:heat shock protein HslJ